MQMITISWTINSFTLGDDTPSAANDDDDDIHCSYAFIFYMNI